MEQERRVGLHGILIIAEMRQGVGDEAVQRGEGIGPGYRPGEIFRCAKMVWELLLYQGHDGARLGH